MSSAALSGDGSANLVVMAFSISGVRCNPSLGSVKHLDLRRVPQPVPTDRPSGSAGFYVVCVADKAVWPPGDQRSGYAVALHSIEHIANLVLQAAPPPFVELLRDFSIDASASVAYFAFGARERVTRSLERNPAPRAFHSMQDRHERTLQATAG